MTTGSNTAGDAPRPIAHDIAAAMAWWRLAGVDGAMVDEPQDWLAETRPKPKADPAAARRAAKQAQIAAEPQIPALGGPAEGWPETLAGFAPWWLECADLAPPGLRRLAPTGPHAAALMVLVEMPEADDGEGLLTGRAGALLDSFLQAAGMSRNAVYIASALPARIAVPDWAELKTRGLGAILARHITLAAPQRTLVFGQGWISALLGHDSPQSAAHLRALNHEQGSVPALATYELGYFLSKPATKAGLWQRWLDWN